MQSAVDNRVAIHQQLAPVSQELRVVVLALGVGLQSARRERCGLAAC